MFTIHAHQQNEQSLTSSNITNPFTLFCVSKQRINHTDIPVPPRKASKLTIHLENQLHICPHDKILFILGLPTVGKSIELKISHIENIIHGWVVRWIG